MKKKEPLEVNPNKPVNEAEAGSYIGGNTPGTMKRWRYLGKGPRFLKIGSKVRYRKSDLDAWLDSQTKTPRLKKRRGSAQRGER